MKKICSPLLVVLTLAAASLACNLPSASREADETAFARFVEQTIAVEAFTGGPQPEATYTPILQSAEGQSPTSPPMPSVPMVSVSVNTNCRTGPGSDYEIVGGLLVGEQAQIVMRSSIPDFVLIDLPDGSGQTCWLWMQYGTQTGDTSGLPEATPPPTPTPEEEDVVDLSFNAQPSYVFICDTSYAVPIHVVNTGSAAFQSYHVSTTDIATNQQLTSQGNTFPASRHCHNPDAPASLEPGADGYIDTKYPYDVSGHPFEVTVRLCTGDNLSGDCITRQISFVAVDISSISDVNAKENFAPVDNQQILDDLLTIPITTWNYIDQTNEGRHLGPMAQDFYAAFGVGESDTFLQTIDTTGVAFAAIQALAERNTDLAVQLQTLQSQNADLQARLTSLESQGGPFPLSIMLVFGLFVAGLAIVLVVRRMNQEEERNDEG